MANPLLLIPVLALLAGILKAQHVNELVPRVGEQRFNRFQYHASHNSFQRGTAPNFISLRSQVDDWGVRQIELDVWYENPGRYVVEHNCCDFDGGGLWLDYLADLASSVAVRTSFVFLNLQLHESADAAFSCEDCFINFPPFYEETLRSDIEAAFGPSSIYTWGDFLQDQRRWPSLQELVRRGKHIAVQGVNYDQASSSTFFFGGFADEVGDATLNQNAAGNYVQVNSPGLDPAAHPWVLGDRWFSRDYPENQLTCPVEPNSDWDDAALVGFTMLATNCVTDEAKISNSRLHPPDPLYVDDVPLGSGEQVGTWGRPYAGLFGLFAAVNRLKAHQQRKGFSNVTIVLESGFPHQTLGSFENSPPFMTITSRDGPVTIVN